MATNQPAAVSNLVTQTTGLTVSIPDPDDPVEKELSKLAQDSEAAQAEVDKWIRENNSFATKGAGVPADVLNTRIRARFEPIKKAYLDLLKRHPDNTDAHIDYGNFLNDTRWTKNGARSRNSRKRRSLIRRTPTPGINWATITSILAR